ncbi:helix-turn-helix domain-containing protein [Martelella alba]|nr:helix-turn-helix domain-containing protein [Martelella alba]
MSGDEYTRLRMAWLDQVFGDAALSKSVATNVAFFISQHFNRKRFGDSGVFSAWPSYATLAEKVGCTSRTVQNAVALLKRRGHLRTKGQGGRHCSLTYFAVLKVGNQERREETDSYEKRGNSLPPFDENEADEAENVETGRTKRGNLDVQNVETGFLLTSMNKSLNKHFEEGARVSDEIAPRPLSGDDAQLALENWSGLNRQSVPPAAAAVAVLAALISGPGQLPPLPPIVRKNPRPEWIRDHQAKHGWPHVYDNLGNPERWLSVFDEMAIDMVPVEASKDNADWQRWVDVYRGRGWPLPSAEGQLVHFPDCGPRGFEAFLSRLAKAMREQVIMEAGNVTRLPAR